MAKLLPVGAVERVGASASERGAAVPGEQGAQRAVQDVGREVRQRGRRRAAGRASRRGRRRAPRRTGRARRRLGAAQEGHAVARLRGVAPGQELRRPARATPSASARAIASSGSTFRGLLDHRRRPRRRDALGPQPLASASSRSSAFDAVGEGAAELGAVERRGQQDAVAARRRRPARRPPAGSRASASVGSRKAPRPLASGNSPGCRAPWRRARDRRRPAAQAVGAAPRPSRGLAAERCAQVAPAGAPWRARRRRGASGRGRSVPGGGARSVSSPPRPRSVSRAAMRGGACCAASSAAASAPCGRGAAAAAGRPARGRGR